MGSAMDKWACRKLGRGTVGMENLKAQSHSQGLVTSQGPERDPANHRRDTDRTDFFCHLLMRPSIFKDFFLLMWTMFKVFIEFVTVLLPFYVLAFWDRGVWDLTFLTRDQIPHPLH